MKLHAMKCYELAGILKAITFFVNTSR